MNVLIEKNAANIFSVFVDGKKAKIFLGNGSCRRTFRVDNLIVKVDPMRNATEWEYNQCISEVYVWNNVIPDNQKGLFAEMLFWGISNGFSFVVQKFYPRDENQASMPERIMDKLTNLCIYDVFSRTDSNWHFSNGVPIVYDYGSFEGCSSLISSMTQDEKIEIMSCASLENAR